MLFTVNDSPYTSTSLSTCLEIVKPGAAVLLYEDAAYAVSPGGYFAELLRLAAQSVKIYVLEEDLVARGIAQSIPEVKLVDYSGFVDLVVEHQVVPWL